MFLCIFTKKRILHFVAFLVVFIPLLILLMYPREQSMQQIDSVSNGQLEQPFNSKSLHRDTARSNHDTKSKTASTPNFTAGMLPSGTETVTNETTTPKSEHVLSMQPQNGTGRSVTSVLDDADKDMMNDTLQQRHVQRMALHRRLSENVELLLALTQAEIADAEREIELISSAYKHLSPKLRDAAKREASKHFSDETVNEFFDSIDSASYKTPTEIISDYQDIKASRDIFRMMDRFVKEEYKQIILDCCEFYGDTEIGRHFQQIKAKLEGN